MTVKRKESGLINHRFMFSELNTCYTIYIGTCVYPGQHFKLRSQNGKAHAIIQFARLDGAADALGITNSRNASRGMYLVVDNSFGHTFFGCCRLSRDWKGRIPLFPILIHPQRYLHLRNSCCKLCAHLIVRRKPFPLSFRTRSSHDLAIFLRCSIVSSAPEWILSFPALLLAVQNRFSGVVCSPWIRSIQKLLCPVAVLPMIPFLSSSDSSSRNIQRVSYQVPESLAWNISAGF